MDYFSYAALFKYPNYCGIIVSVLYTSVCMYILYIYMFIYPSMDYLYIGVYIYIYLCVCVYIYIYYIHLYINNPYIIYI